MQSKLSLRNNLIYILIAIGAILLSALLWNLSQRQKLKKVNLALELKNLRNQMNPHFIFNVLVSIQDFILSNRKKLAHDYLIRFSRLIRQVFEYSKKDLVTLEDEINVTEKYLQLENIRYQNNLSYDIKIDPSIMLNEILVAPLLIHPFLENSRKHGIRGLDNAIISIKINRMNEKLLKIEVQDNGIGFTQSKENKKNNTFKDYKSSGIKMTRKRLNLLHSMKSLNLLFETEDVTNNKKEIIGAKVTFTAPYESKGENN